MAGRPRARKLLPMIGVRFADPLEAVGIDSRCGREPPAPPRKAVPECAASGSEVCDHSRNRDLHRTSSVVSDSSGGSESSLNRQEITMRMRYRPTDPARTGCPRYLRTMPTNRSVGGLAGGEILPHAS